MPTPGFELMPTSPAVRITNHYTGWVERLSDTMASAVLADLTRALQGTNGESGPAMEESENDVGSLEQLLLYVEEHYLAGKNAPGETI
ncbi:hypothetical protein TNCV_1738901 [Trichonephila clavipes]|nr:hypothetical protein TNCV_1738901 [Trichonephila clavipes]